MSIDAQVAVLGPWTAPGPRSSGVGGARPGPRLARFTAVALLSILSWASLFGHAPRARLAGELAVSALVAGAGALAARRSALLVIPLGLIGGLAMLALAGVPLSWLVHARIALCGRWIADGLSGLPQALLPYLSQDDPVWAVMLLGSGLLLLCGALTLALAPRRPAEGWLAAAALPLVALAVLPTTLLPQALPYLRGAVLFLLLAALIWADRTGHEQRLRALALAALAGAGGLLAAPAVDPHRSWVDVQGLAGKLGAGAVEQFQFAQNLGPLHWPRGGREVFDVRALRPDYWKVEDLDLFDGRGFVGGLAPTEPLPAVDPAVRRRFTQTIRVTVRGLESAQLIAAGIAGVPVGLRRAVQPGLAPGTWTLQTPLLPGDSYRVQTISADPGPVALASAGSAYPDRALAPYRSMLLPSSSPAGGSEAILFAPFHQGPTAALTDSPYARAYALAQRLAAEADSPYDFVRRVLGYLSHGFRYDENPPPSRFALESFLFSTRRGYCQQFSGAMALLLRMGGLPARVAGGFTTGRFDLASHQWVVSDLDAHDWVEVWFPHYGWVRFDPTPGADPARAAVAPRLLLGPRPNHPVARVPVHRTAVGHPHHPRAPRTARGAQRPPGSGVGPWLVVMLVVTALVLLSGWAWWGAAAGPDALTDELERALRRCGRPLPAGSTLAGLERRLAYAPAAAAYVRALRLHRYAGAEGGPTGAQRRALRAALGDHLGRGGGLRAWWALPPRRLPQGESEQPA